MTKVNRNAAAQSTKQTEVAAEAKRAPAFGKKPAKTEAASSFTAAAAAKTDTVAFNPASNMKYECTIHTLQMTGDDGRKYNVVLDLIRNDKNEAWGINSDHQALRAVVTDAVTGQVVSSKFIDTPKSEFGEKVGDLKAMGKDGKIAFASADGAMDFDLDVTLKKSTVAQAGTDALKNAMEAAIAGLPKDQREAAKKALPLQLLVTDYPKSEHTGSLTLKLPGSDKPLKLTADQTPSTVSHHYGNALSDYVFLASVPKPGQPSFIAVVSKEEVDLDKSKVGGEISFPVGYIIKTDANGKSTFALLNADAKKKGDGFSVGGGLFGAALDVKVKTEAGQVAVNDGQLVTKTGFGEVTLKDPALLRALGLGGETKFSDVVVDVTGSFIAKTGR